MHQLQVFPAVSSLFPPVPVRKQKRMAEKAEDLLLLGYRNLTALGGLGRVSIKKTQWMDVDG